MAHTPGPWNVCERWPYQPDGLHINWDRLQTMWIVGVRPGVATAAAETEDDARLIAAAPEMFKELHTVSDWLMTVASDMDCNASNPDGGSVESCDHCQWLKSLNRIDALLLKAGSQ